MFYHRIVFAKFNLQVFIHLLALVRTGTTEKEIQIFSGVLLSFLIGQRAFTNIDFNQKVKMLTKNILNVLSNFTHIIFDDNGHAWMTNKIKGLVQQKNLRKDNKITDLYQT